MLMSGHILYLLQSCFLMFNYRSLFLEGLILGKLVIQLLFEFFWFHG